MSDGLVLNTRNCCRVGILAKVQSLASCCRQHQEDLNAFIPLTLCNNLAVEGTRAQGFPAFLLAAVVLCGNRHTNSHMLKTRRHVVAVLACCRPNWKGVVDARGRECRFHHGSNRHRNRSLQSFLEETVHGGCAQLQVQGPQLVVHGGCQQRCHAV